MYAIKHIPSAKQQTAETRSAGPSVSNNELLRTLCTGTGDV